jgi:hypothetical protein
MCTGGVVPFGHTDEAASSLPILAAHAQGLFFHPSRHQKMIYKSKVSPFTIIIIIVTSATHATTQCLSLRVQHDRHNNHNHHRGRLLSAQVYTAHS